MSDSITQVAEETTSVAAAEIECTGLPCLKSWRATYFFTLVSFATWIVLLVALTECFS